MPIKRDDFESGWGNIPQIGIGKEKIRIGKYEFDKEFVSKTPWFAVMLVICSDPTPKQIEMMEKIDFILEDDLGQRFWPRKLEEEPDEEAEFPGLDYTSEGYETKKSVDKAK